MILTRLVSFTSGLIGREGRAHLIELSSAGRSPLLNSKSSRASTPRHSCRYGAVAAIIPYTLALRNQPREWNLVVDAFRRLESGVWSFGIVAQSTARSSLEVVA